MKILLIILAYFVIGCLISFSISLGYKIRKKKGLDTFFISKEENDFVVSISLITVFWIVLLALLIVGVFVWFVIVKGFEIYGKIVDKITTKLVEKNR